MGSMCSFLSGSLLIPSGYRYRHGSVWLQFMTYKCLFWLAKWKRYFICQNPSGILSGKFQDVFGVATAAQIDIDKTKLVERDNQLSRRVSQLTYYVNTIFSCLSSWNLFQVCDIFTAVTANKPRTMKLTIVRQRDKLEIVFKVGCEKNVVHTILKHTLTYLDFRKNQLLQFLEYYLFSALLMWGPINCQRESFLLCGLPVSYA